MRRRRELTPLRKGLGRLLLSFPFLFTRALPNPLMPGKGLSPDFCLQTPSLKLLSPTQLDKYPPAHLPSSRDRFTPFLSKLDSPNDEMLFCFLEQSPLM